MFKVVVSCILVLNEKTKDMKNLKEVRKKANELMNTNYTIPGFEKKTINIVEDLGYKFEFRNYKRALGKCHMTMRKISLSKHWIEINLENDAQIIDVLLHEIAHAIAYKVFRDHGHGKDWKKVCVLIGARPERCCDPFKSNLKQPKGKYVYECPSCKSQHHFYRRKKRNSSCGNCSPRYNEKYKLKLVS